MFLKEPDPLAILFWELVPEVDLVMAGLTNVGHL